MNSLDSIKPDAVQSLDLEGILSLADDLSRVLDTARDFSVLAEVQQEISDLKSVVEEDLSEVQTALKGIEGKVLVHEREVESAKKEGVADEKLQSLHTELEREQQYEHQLMQELRVIEDEMDRLELERSRIESHKEAVNKAKKEEIRAQSELSLYASISRIIPDLSAMDKYMGHIVDREKQKIEKFEFDRTKMSCVEICNRLWEMADS
ncbi:kinetochore protein SPC24 homolog [Cryptomeria japonica]|uniref:kinetochore protein SPC24 homolog n=1 Tax=Cryptomeria japonica TaxID=3369 RepID=UPI0027DA9836|nr:kinetochore protein SPC24 homolog [Cryptomeria japonica]XP_059077261.1 kinetochore protein SPC24 homolog [Cryptomeria japonica]